MSTVESTLWSVAQSIEPTTAQKSAAAASHNYLRDLLNSGQMQKRITGSYLSGSYARDTAIRPIDDVDVVFLIRVSEWPETLLGLLQPSPSVVLESFASAIRYRYPVSSVFGQRRSVRLELHHLDIDVVPAIPVTDDGLVVLIPDRRADTWIRSSPQKHARNASQLNQARGGLFKPLVKLLKQWNGQLPSTAQLRSFTIETAAMRLFWSLPFASLEQGLLYFFDFWSSVGGLTPRWEWRRETGIELGWTELSVPDFAGTGSNTAAGLSRDVAAKSAIHAERARRKLEEASRATLLTATTRVRELFLG